MNLPLNINPEEKKKLILAKEQYYLDKYSPSLNINKTAGSLLGYKHTEANKLKFSLTHRGKSYKKTPNPFISKRLVSNETILKLKSRTRGAAVCVYDVNLNLVEQFPTIKQTAKFVGLSPSSVSKYITKATFWNNRYCFKFKQD